MREQICENENVQTLSKFENNPHSYGEILFGLNMGQIDEQTLFYVKKFKKSTDEFQCLHLHPKPLKKMHTKKKQPKEIQGLSKVMLLSGKMPISLSFLKAAISFKYDSILLLSIFFPIRKTKECNKSFYFLFSSIKV